MPNQIVENQLELYNKLKNILKQFTESFNSHSDETSLSEQGVELSKFDLHRGTDNEDIYFRLLTRTCVMALKEQPDIDLEFMPSKRCCIRDAIDVDGAIVSRFFRLQNKGSDHLAHKLSP